MKYAIYDKAADGYLTKMEFEVGYSEHTQFECALTEYITNAELLNTKEAANLAIINIENFKCMEKGRFVVHSFDEELADQYIISEAGTPTKVVDNITVDLSGTIDVKYGTMPLHWSTPYLIRAITRLDALQKASSDVYTHWNDTFDIYKVITVIDERECTHYQFINVTEKGRDSAKEEETPLNKRIEELEKANVMLNDNVNYHNECRLTLVEIIRYIKYAICSKDSYKCDNYISYVTDRIKNDEIFNRPELKTAKNDIPKICKHLTALSKDSLNKRIEELEKANYDLGEQVTARGSVANRLQEEKEELEAKVESIKKEARNWKTMYESALTDNSFPCISAEACELLKDITDITRAKKLANDIINIWEADDKFEVTLKKFSQLYEAVNNPSDDDDTIMYALKGVLEIFSSLEDHVRDIIDESVTWKNRAVKAEASLAGQKALNNANADTIERMRTAGADWKRKCGDKDKEIKELRTMRDCLSEIIWAVCNAITNNSTNAFDCIESRMRHDPDFNSDPFMAGVRENVKDICSHEKINITNNNLKNSEIARLTKERDKALEQKEFYKRQANSVYGMTVPCWCNCKQMFYDVTTGKKMLVDKDKYDDIVERINNLTK